MRDEIVQMTKSLLCSVIIPTLTLELARNGRLGTNKVPGKLKGFYCLHYRPLYHFVYFMFQYLRWLPDVILHWLLTSCVPKMADISEISFPPIGQ